MIDVSQYPTYPDRDPDDFIRSTSNCGPWRAELREDKTGTSSVVLLCRGSVQERWTEMQQFSIDAWLSLAELTRNLPVLIPLDKEE